MLALVIETATERAIVAIVKDNTCLYMAGLPFGFHNSKFLVPKIDEAFYEIQKTPYDLNAIVVGNGPGSYTGIRVGATVAKTLSYTCKIPLIGISTLESFVPDHDGTFCSILDAKFSGFYVLKGSKSSGIVTYQGEPQICEPSALNQFLLGVEVLVTPYAEVLQQKIRKLIPEKEWEWQETAPDPLVLARRATSQLENENYSLDGSVEILYLRK